MRKFILCFTVLSCLPLFAGPSAKKPAAAKPAAAATKKAPSQTAAHKSGTKKSKSKKTVVSSYRSVQQHPTTERYLQIQQALVDRGYMEVANGNWSVESVDALKKFQQDQDLTPDGKIGALSLMALGLGPRRGAFVVAQVPTLASPTPVE
jgi:murein L,D-transpeptidase YcbB/YkuD